MRKRILLSTTVILLLCLVACSTGKIIVKDDEFTKGKTITMSQKPSLAEWSRANLWLWECEYFREIKNRISIPTVISMTLWGSTQVENFDYTAMLKVDDKVFNIAGIKATGETKKDTSASIRTDSAGNTTGSVTSNEYKEFKIKITLTPQVEKAMLSATTISLRLKAGLKPVTIVYKPDEVEQLKKFVGIMPAK
jgi:hypothetical protein